MAKKTARANLGAASGSIDTDTSATQAGSDISNTDSKTRQNVDGHGSLATDPLPTVRVNKANLGEIKSALDDIVKKYLTAQAFTPSLLHPTVHLSLGYTSIIFSLGSVLYSLRVPFEESKPGLWVGVVGYFVLQGVLWAWKRWVEAGEVFQGKRRRMVKRIETDIVHVVSSTSLDPPPSPLITHSPHTRPSSPSTLSTPASPTALSPASSDTALHSRDTSSTSATSAVSSTTTAQSSTKHSTSSSASSPTGPTYSLHLSLSTTSNNGKSLLHKSRVVAGRGIGEFVDVNGGVEEGEVERWISALLVDAGLVGAEEEGAKEE